MNVCVQMQTKRKELINRTIIDTSASTCRAADRPPLRSQRQGEWRVHVKIRPNYLRIAQPELADRSNRTRLRARVDLGKRKSHVLFALRRCHVAVIGNIIRAV